MNIPLAEVETITPEDHQDTVETIGWNRIFCGYCGGDMELRENHRNECIDREAVCLVCERVCFEVKDYE